MIKSRFRGMMALVLMSASILAGCNGKDGEPGPTGNHLGGSITGFLRLVNQYGTEKSDYSGVKVSLVGSSPMLTATSDREGRFVFESVPTGTYHVKYEKAGMLNITRPSLGHIGGETPTLVDFTTVADQPDISVSHVDVDVTTNSNGMYVLWINMTLDKPVTDGKGRRIIVLLNPGTSVAQNNYLNSYSYQVTSGQTLNVSITLPAVQYPAGSKVSVIAAGYNSFSSIVRDVETGRTNLTGTSPHISNRAEVVLQ